MPRPLLGGVDRSPAAIRRCRTLLRLGSAGRRGRTGSATSVPLASVKCRERWMRLEAPAQRAAPGGPDLRRRRGGPRRSVSPVPGLIRCRAPPWSAMMSTRRSDRPPRNCTRRRSAERTALLERHLPEGRAVSGHRGQGGRRAARALGGRNRRIDGRSRPSGDSDTENRRVPSRLDDAASDGAADRRRTPSAEPRQPSAASRSATERVGLGSRLSSFTSNLLRKRRTPSSACLTTGIDAQGSRRSLRCEGLPPASERTRVLALSSQ